MIAFTSGYLVALAAALVAVVWVVYLRAVEARAHGWAALADAALIGLSGLVVLGYVQDWRALLWAMGGGGLGTWVASRFLR